MRRSLIPMLTLPALVLAGCKAKTPPPPPPIVEVAEVAGADAALSTEFIGQLDSPQNVEVRARVEAFVEKIPFTEGTEVKAGDPLFVLDARPYQERLAAAQGAMAQSQAALKKYQADVARLQPLAEKKAVPQQDLDNALASVDIGKADVLTSKARVESAELDLGYCDVRAPISGLIGATSVQIGELVGKGLPTLLATISKLDPIWFYCNVGEVQYLRAQTETRRLGRDISDLPVSLILPDGTTHFKPGKFVFIDRAVDPKTGTLRVRAEFPNPEKLLRPGMFGRIKVDIGTQANSILIPERAITELQGKSFIWVIGGDNKASQRAVKLGQQLGSNYMVLEGLKPGDRYVVEGLQKVRDGQVVQPMTTAQLAAAQPAEQPAAEAPAKKSEKE